MVLFYLKKFFLKDQQISFETYTYIYSFFLVSNTPHKACVVFSYIELLNILNVYKNVYL